MFHEQFDNLVGIGYDLSRSVLSPITDI